MRFGRELTEPCTIFYAPHGRHEFMQNREWVFCPGHGWRPLLVQRLYRATNRALRPVGLMLVPRAPSAKMLIEHSNTSEHHHPSHGGNTVKWMRRIARIMGKDDR